MNTDLVNQVHCSEFFDLARQVDDASIDLYLGDLPYGVTACKWDSVIPLEPMWAELKRIIKPRGAIVLTATQPFTSALVMSNPKMFRYAWVWVKSRKGGFLNAYKMPMSAHEDILVFGDSLPNYYPQTQKIDTRTIGSHRHRGSDVYGAFTPTVLRTDVLMPSSALFFPHDPELTVTYAQRPEKLPRHPTQKPVALFEYLIQTYTRSGELVADFTVGSGTTAVASRNLGRDFIVGDYTPEYCEIARKRLSKPFTPRMFENTPLPQETIKQDSMF